MLASGPAWAKAGWDPISRAVMAALQARRRASELIIFSNKRAIYAGEDMAAGNATHRRTEAAPPALRMVKSMPLKTSKIF